MVCCIHFLLVKWHWIKTMKWSAEVVFITWSKSAEMIWNKLLNIWSWQKSVVKHLSLTKSCIFIPFYLTKEVPTEVLKRRGGFTRTVQAWRLWYLGPGPLRTKDADELGTSMAWINGGAGKRWWFFLQKTNHHWSFIMVQFIGSNFWICFFFVFFLFLQVGCWPSMSHFVEATWGFLFWWSMLTPLFQLAQALRFLLPFQCSRWFCRWQGGMTQGYPWPGSQIAICNIRLYDDINLYFFSRDGPFVDL